MTWWWVGVFGLLLGACGPSATSDAGSADGGVPVDAPVSGDAGSDGAIDAALRDAGELDAGVDASPPPDAGPCEPRAGEGVFAGRCARVRVAVLADDDGPAHVEVRGRLFDHDMACPRFEAVEVGDAEGALSSFGAERDALASAFDEGVAFIARGLAPEALVDACEAGEGRLAFTVVVEARVDGGRATASCGGLEDAAWPPSVVLTCHRNLPASPIAEAGLFFEGTLVDLLDAYPAEPDPAVTEIVGEVRVEPISPPHRDPIATLTTDDWITVVDPPIGGVVTLRLATFESEFLDEVLCPEAPDAFAPALIFGVRGQAGGRELATELYLPRCSRF